MPFLIDEFSSGGIPVPPGTLVGQTLVWSGLLWLPTSVLFTDTANNRVGINQTTPLAALHIGDGISYGPDTGIAFGDGDSRLYERLDDQFALSIAGVEYIRMGAGWTIEGGLSGTGGVIREIATATNPTLAPSNSYPSSGIGSAGADIPCIIANSINILNCIEDSGSPRVGIGTTTPNEILTIGNFTDGFNNIIKMRTDTGNDLGIEFFENAEKTGMALIYDGGDNNLYIKGGAGLLSNLVTFERFGNVGMGTTSPNATLSVNGGQTVKKTNQGASDYNPSALTSDYIITVDNSAAARAVTISDEDVQSGSTTEPRIMIIKDQELNAASNNITISLESGNIDGQASLVLSGDGDSVTLYLDGTNGYII